MEFKRVFHSNLFWISLLIGCVITISQYLMYVLPCVKYLDLYLNNPFGTECPHTWYEKWIGGELSSSQSYIYFMIIPILAVLPHSISLANDRSTGYTYNLFVRNRKSQYYFSKYLVTFIIGGVVVILPLIINIILSVCTLPSILPDTSTGTSMIMGNMMWADFYFKSPNLYIAFYLLIIFVFSGIIATFALTIGSFVYNAFVITVMPFICYLFSYAICTLSHSLEYCPFMFLTPAQRVEHISFPIILMEIIILMLIIGNIYYYQMRRDETLN